MVNFFGVYMHSHGMAQELIEMQEIPTGSMLYYKHHYSTYWNEGDGPILKNYCLSV
jgi:hypothetical protein